MSRLKSFVKSLLSDLDSGRLPAMPERPFTQTFEAPACRLEATFPSEEETAVLLYCDNPQHPSAPFDTNQFDGVEDAIVAMAEYLVLHLPMEAEDVIPLPECQLELVAPQGVDGPTMIVRCDNPSHPTAELLSGEPGNTPLESLILRHVPGARKRSNSAKRLSLSCYYALRGPTFI